MNREPTYQAVFDKFGRIEGFVTKSRRLKHWSDVAPTSQPALFFSQKGEDAKTTTGMPTIWTLRADLYLYVNTSGDPDKPPSQLMNPLVDKIVQMLLPDNTTGRQTLGGLVSHCRIDGSIETDEGALGDQGVAIIPIQILLPE